MVERLYKGIHKFQSSHFKRREGLFRSLSTHQNPEVLFITCADSRVDEPTSAASSRHSNPRPLARGSTFPAVSTR